MRDNGLTATSYTSLGGIDPLVAEPVLDALAAAGIAAYCENQNEARTPEEAEDAPARIPVGYDEIFVDAEAVDLARPVIDRSTEDAEWRSLVEQFSKPSAPGHDGGEVYVVEAGSGPPIVLSHGVTLSVRTWARQLDDLSAAGFRVIAFDHRGHGESTVGTSGHGVEQLAHDMRTVLEGLDLHDAVLVGHSMGGIAAQSFCIRHPDIARARVAGIVLLSSLARSPLGASPRVSRMLTQVMNRLPDGTAALEARDLGLIISRVGFGRNPNPAHVEAARQMMLATGSATRRDAMLPGATRTSTRSKPCSNSSAIANASTASPATPNPRAAGATA